MRVLSCKDEHCSGRPPQGPLSWATAHLCFAVGKPIEVQQVVQPSREQVDELHQRYIHELCNLFEAHKLKYNVPADQHLEFC